MMKLPDRRIYHLALVTIINFENILFAIVAGDEYVKLKINVFLLIL